MFYVAGFWRRTLAAVVDFGVLTPMIGVLLWITGELAHLRFPPTRQRGVDYWLDLVLALDPALVAAVGLSCAIVLVYLLFFQVTAGRTPGMRVLRIRVIDAYGDALGGGRAVARTLAFLTGVGTLFLGFLWIGFDREKRGLHDWLSGTYVVKG